MHNLPKISTSQKTTLIFFLTLEELQCAVYLSQNNKVPGPDDFSIEFYKTFSKLITLLYNCYIQSKGTLLTKINNSKLVLLHKKDPKNNLDNYRPLTMLNSDYKIIAKILANRL